MFGVSPSSAEGSDLAPARLGPSLVAVWRQWAAARWGALAVMLGVYGVLSLAPFDWELPAKVANGARPSPEGWDLPVAGIVVSDAPLAWLEAAREAEELELAVVVRPRLASQSGPARIVTISRDAHLRNLTLAQEDDDLVLRLRSEETDLNGLRDGEPVARVADVFRAATWVAIDLQIRPGQLAIAVDGRQRLRAELPAAVLGTWDPSMSLALGNEMTCDRPWLGEIRKAVVRGPDRVARAAGADGARVPATCWRVGYVPALVPFRLFLPGDAVRNVLMYIPLGLLIGLMAGARTRLAMVGGLLVILGVSLTFEITQLFVASRFPAVDDTINNTIGGAVGLCLARWLTREPATTAALRPPEEPP